jgi:ATP-dependent Lon protease
MLGLNKPLAENLAVLPLRDIVVFPHMIVPLFVGREKSVKCAWSTSCTPISRFC